MKFIVIDGYVDEPTCLGVPPYISTYVRYTAGAARLGGASSVGYITIDELRNSDYLLKNGKTFFDAAAIIAGTPVPGKYLGGIPLRLNEIEKIAQRNRKTLFLVGGPIRFSSDRPQMPNIINIRLDIESYVYRFISGASSIEKLRTPEEVEKFSTAGAFIVQFHPRYPDIIAEIETGRGCPRKTHCSFCIEGSYEVMCRSPEGVIREISELRKEGVLHFRLGKQADLYSFGSRLKEWVNGFPKPDTGSVLKLYEGIRNAVPDLKTLHLDNVNPGTISNFPDESAIISNIIAKFNTPGDVAALGMESADPAVIERNCLKAFPEEVMKAIEIINSAGGSMGKEISKLLPGVNLIRGLPGETRETFKMNYEFLLKVLDSGLILRRINIRQLRLSSGTGISRMHSFKDKNERMLDAAFRNYRGKIRRDVDMPMIKKVFPPGTIIPDAIVEMERGDWSIARPIGTYPIAVNIPEKLPILKKISVFVVGFRERSLIGLPYPFYLKDATHQELRQIPGLSKKAGELMAKKKILKTDLNSSPIFKKIKDFIR